ncbi:hypothetical protein B0H14DRAFT_2556541 [Mycena olivaceomarginata]|nr:hypothetical protein B0H14DRAFT_2556541 [Mycena olivaceomarginata]
MHTPTPVPFSTLRVLQYSIHGSSKYWAPYCKKNRSFAISPWGVTEIPNFADLSLPKIENSSSQEGTQRLKNCLDPLVKVSTRTENSFPFKPVFPSSLVRVSFFCDFVLPKVSEPSGSIGEVFRPTRELVPIQIGLPLNCGASLNELRTRSNSSRRLPQFWSSLFISLLLLFLGAIEIWWFGEVVPSEREAEQSKPKEMDLESWPPRDAAHDQQNEVPYEDMAHHLTLIGIVGIDDLLRPGVLEAVKKCQMAGLDTPLGKHDLIWRANYIPQVDR